MPIRYVFGEILEDSHKHVLMHGDKVRDRSGKEWIFAGLSGDNKPLLAKDERELKRMKVEIENALLHYESYV